MDYVRRKKTRVFLLVISSICWILLLNHGIVKAEEVADIGPEMSFDFIVLIKGHSVSISTSVNYPFDLVIQQALLIGGSNFSASVSKTDTEGEVLGITAFGVDFGHIGHPRYLFDADVGFTPQTGISASFAVYDAALVTVISTVLFSTETEPGRMSVSLRF